jgi:hypothetical protein
MSSKKQLDELEKHHNRIDEQGKSMMKGSIPWLLEEALENITRLEDLVGPKHDRPSKKDIKIILRDLRDQIRELKIRLD